MHGALQDVYKRQVQPVERGLGQGATVVGLQAGHAALGYVVVVAIDQHGAQAQPAQHRSQLAGKGVSADDECSLWLALGQTQSARNWAAGQPIEDDRADNDQEDERRQQLRFGHAQFGQFESEDGSNRSGDDAARGHPH